MKRLNNKGISHLLVPLLVVVAVGIVGTYLLVSSHADSLNSTTATTTEPAINNPADPSVPLSAWPDEAQTPDATYEKITGPAASASKSNGTKSYNLTIIGKKDGGPCTGSKTTSGCKQGTSYYHRVSTSSDRLHVYTNADGKCTAKVPGIGSVSYKVDKGYSKLGSISKGLKVKCTFANGQYYNFKLTHDRKFQYWGSAKKRMVAHDQYGTFGKTKNRNYIVLGSDR